MNLLSSFLFNNQPDVLIIQIYSVIKFYVFRASSVPIIRSFLLYIRHWWVSCRFLMTVSKQSQDGNVVPSWLLGSGHQKPAWCSPILTLLGSGHQKPAWNLPVLNVQQKTPDDGHKRCPKHVESGWNCIMQVFDERFQAASGRKCSSILAAWKRSSKTCMKLTSAECTVENSWWWAEKMPETCRVL